MVLLQGLPALSVPVPRMLSVPVPRMLSEQMPQGLPEPLVLLSVKVPAPVPAEPLFHAPAL
jgi:hypothetical protein